MNDRKRSRQSEPERTYDEPAAAPPIDAAIPAPIPPIGPIIPPYVGSSGLYVWSLTIPIPTPLPTAVEAPPALPDSATTPIPPLAPIPLPFRREELRLDVDRWYPQSTASGTAFSGLTTKVHWIARLTPAGRDAWTGAIWYKDGATAAFPYTNVAVRVTRGLIRPVSASVTFSGGGGTPRTLVYSYVSPYFHPVQFEFDSAEGTTAVTKINTWDHPDRPAGLPNETLTLRAVYQRAGFDVSSSGGDNVVPLSLAGGNGTWSDLEMHDAMQVYWSRFAPKAQWSLWVFFAALHDQGTSLGGIMFDDIGPNQRQGTAIFESSFIASAPAGDPAPPAWVSRMRFWTAAHEMGHSFNLAHSWQKALTNPGVPWIALANEPTAGSYMNYPYRVPPGPQEVFFRNFELRFSDSELLFMRHAPFRFVQQGNALWFDHHGFEGAEVDPASPLRLELRLNRARPILDFLEPAVLELKLTNVSGEPVLVPAKVLARQDQMSIVIKKAGGAARQYLPFARYCFRDPLTVLAAGDSTYDSLFVGAGRNGWDLAEPGLYTVQVALHLEGQDVVSNPLRLRVTAPEQHDHEVLAQDFFSDDVGRILAFDGSSVLAGAVDALRAVSEQLPDSRAAVHARLALGNAESRPRKRLELDASNEAATAAHRAGGRIVETRADRKEAAAALAGAFGHTDAAETLGHVDYKDYGVAYAQWLVERGDATAAARLLGDVRETLAARNVLPRVLSEVAERQQECLAGPSSRPLSAPA